jgi:hypothetical protein
MAYPQVASISGVVSRSESEARCAIGKSGAIKFAIHRALRLDREFWQD